MRNALTITVIALLSTLANAAEISVGGTTLTVRTPQGFARLTDDMQPLYDVALDTANPNNRRLVTFIDENVAPLARAGELLTLERFINIEIMRKLEPTIATSADFAQVQGLIRDDLDKAIAKIERSMPQKMADLSTKVSETLDVELALSLSNVVPIPVHQQDERLISHSMVVKYEMSEPAGRTDFIVTVTTTYLFLKGKILYVYVYGGPDDLSWTRAEAAELAAEILSAN